MLVMIVFCLIGMGFAVAAIIVGWPRLPDWWDEEFPPNEDDETRRNLGMGP